MQRQQQFLSATLLLTLAVATHAAHAIAVDPDGIGLRPAVDVRRLSWAPGNSLITPVGNASIFTHPLGDVFQRYTHASLAGFEDSKGASIAVPPPSQWTYIAGYREQVVSTVGNSVVLDTIGGGDNFFRLYFDPTPNASSGNGTGYGPDATNHDAVLALSGRIDASNGQTAISALRVTPGNLDTSGSNNYPGVNSIAAHGNGMLAVTVDRIDTAYFPAGFHPGLTLNFQIVLDLPFSRTDPSSCFKNGANALIDGAGPNTLAGPECGMNTVGSINGIDGTDLILMTDSSSAFTQAASVPEPESLALLGMGLAAMMRARRKRPRKTGHESLSSV